MSKKLTGLEAARAVNVALMRDIETLRAELKMVREERNDYILKYANLKLEIDKVKEMVAMPAPEESEVEILDA